MAASAPGTALVAIEYARGPRVNAAASAGVSRPFEANPQKEKKKWGCRRPLFRCTAVIHGDDRRTSPRGVLRRGTSPRGAFACILVRPWQLNHLLPRYCTYMHLLISVVLYTAPFKRHLYYCSFRKQRLTWCCRTCSDYKRRT